MNRSLPFVVTALVTLGSAIILLGMGRAPWCPCGYVLPWYGPLGTDQGNMHLTDWYTPSHIIHGILFFGALLLVARRMPLGWRLVIATLVEAAWEVTENTNMVIDRYREVTVSADYNGDSVLNSMVDIVAMWLGFWLARKLPVWATVAVVIGFEALTMLLIRDGLALNVLMLVAPSQAVLDWQAGAP
ncbi:DUF2585 family protein [Mesobacterium pallidum]|uniref:DUF2585 family protein n=1 Tax=Mesobacterium pallidum TaxID=2872037 RepID=UPI001EE19B31|nr:DUF2585 family protein [Mesobacterium pallidum]